MKTYIPSFLVSMLLLSLLLLFLKFEHRIDISYAQATSPMWLSLSSFILFNFLVLFTRAFLKK
jgi:hypothetical protein